MPLGADTRTQFAGLWDVYLWIGVAVGAIVVAAIFSAIVRSIRHDGQAPSARRSAPRAEAAVLTAIAAIVLLLLTLTFTTEAHVDRNPPAARTITIVAARWHWRFEYPGTGVVSDGGGLRPSVLVVPRGESVRFQLISRDVVHAFWIPDMRFMRSAFPGRSSVFTLTFGPEQQDSLGGACTEYCGLYHTAMVFTVRVLQPPAFDRWLARREAAAIGATNSDGPTGAAGATGPGAAAL